MIVCSTSITFLLIRGFNCSFHQKLFSLSKDCLFSNIFSFFPPWYRFPGYFLQSNHFLRRPQFLVWDIRVWSCHSHGLLCQLICKKNLVLAIFETEKLSGDGLPDNSVFFCRTLYDHALFRRSAADRIVIKSVKAASRYASHSYPYPFQLEDEREIPSTFGHTLPFGHGAWNTQALSLQSSIHLSGK